MKREQTLKLFEVEHKLNECRELLDDVRFRIGGLDEREFNLCQTCFDYVCKALDQL